MASILWLTSRSALLLLVLVLSSACRPEPPQIHPAGYRLSPDHSEFYIDSVIDGWILRCAHQTLYMGEEFQIREDTASCFWLRLRDPRIQQP